ARPTPAAAHIVSSKSSINCLIGAVIFSMRAPFCRRAGWPYLRIGKTISSEKGRVCCPEVKHGRKRPPELKGHLPGHLRSNSARSMIERLRPSEDDSPSPIRWERAG